jgi:hypothetical protein
MMFISDDGSHARLLSVHLPGNCTDRRILHSCLPIKMQGCDVSSSIRDLLPPVALMASHRDRSQNWFIGYRAIHFRLADTHYSKWLSNLIS